MAIVYISNISPTVILIDNAFPQDVHSLEQYIYGHVQKYIARFDPFSFEGKTQLYLE